jgi:hypothetical protein
MGSHHKLRVRTWALYFLTFEQHFPLQLLATFLAVCLTIVCLKLGLFMFFPAEKLQHTLQLWDIPKLQIQTYP